MYAVQNRQKRTWVVPEVQTNSARHAAVFIEPGDTALVQDDQWDHVKKGNAVIAALLSSRALVVTAPGAVKDVHVDELANPKSPAAPDELKQSDERVEVTTKTELKEVALNDAPAEAKKGPGRPRKEATE